MGSEMCIRDSVKSHEDMVRIGYGQTRRLTRNLTMGERIELNYDGDTERELPRNVTESRGQKSVFTRNVNYIEVGSIVTR